MNIYVASSWRNNIQPLVIDSLKMEGFEVYDFRNPKPGNKGFAWSEVDKNWLNWTPQEFVNKLSHPTAEYGYGLDISAMLRSDTCILVLPCGRSAHLEAGYFIGAGKKLIIYIPGALDKSGGFEPELMYKMTDLIFTNFNDVIKELKS